MNSLLTAQEVALQFNVSRDVVYDWVKYGLIRSIHLPPSRPSRAKVRNKLTIRIPIEAVEEFRENASKQPDDLRKSEV